MIATSHLRPTCAKSSPHDDFLQLLPVVLRAARHFFRALQPVYRDEAIAEAVAAAFVSFVDLKRRGRDPFQFPSVIAVRAVQHVRNDRHVGGTSSSQDVLALKARNRRGFEVQAVPMIGRWQEALIDIRRTPIPDQVWFRIDVPVWLATLSLRDRRLAVLLAEGYSTKEAAQYLGLTPPRISQLRRELHSSWRKFQGEPAASVR